MLLNLHLMVVSLYTLSALVVVVCLDRFRSVFLLVHIAYALSVLLALWASSPSLVALSGLCALLFALEFTCQSARSDFRLIMRQPRRHGSDPAMFAQGQEELRFTKTTQWSLMYYVTGVLGGLLLLSPVPADKVLASDWKTVLLFASAIATFVYGLYITLAVLVGLRNSRLGIALTSEYRARFRTGADFRRERRNDVRLARDIRYYVPFLLVFIGLLTILSYRLWPEFRCMINAVMQP